MDNNPVKPAVERPRRIIKRYSNRKLYDTRDSRYVTLLQIADLVRAGEEVQIIDNSTKEDKTEVTLALIISEELKTQPRSVPLGTLRELIHQRGERLLSTLREGPIGRLIPGTTDGIESDEKVEKSEKSESQSKGLRPLQGLVESSKQALDQWQHAIDERISAALPNFLGFRDLQAQIRTLEARVAALEGEIAGKADKHAHGATSDENSHSTGAGGE